MSTLLKKIVAVVSGLMFVWGVFGTMGVAQAAISAECRADLTKCTNAELTEYIAELTATLNTLRARVSELEGQQQTGGTRTYEGIPAGFTFTKTLKLGMSNQEVVYLKRILAAEGCLSGVTYTPYFGTKTKAGVVCFQEKYASEILAPFNLTKGTGVVGPSTRAKLNSLLATGTPTVPPVTPSVSEPTASLSSDNPPASVLPQHAAKVPLLKVKLQAANEALTITGMTFKRTGVGATTDWGYLYLYDGEGNRLTTLGRSLSSDTHEVEFAGLNISIPAAGSKEIVLRGDVAGTTPGNQSAFQLVSIAGATFKGLPITGNTMTIGGISVNSVTVQAQTGLLSPVVGTQGAVIGKFSVTAGNAAVDLKQVIVTISGSISRGEVTNIQLYDSEGNLLAQTPKLDSYDYAILTLPTPYTIPATVTKTLTVKADLGGRVGSTLEAKISSNDDVLAIDKTQGYGAIVSGAPVSCNTLTLKGGTLSLANQGPSAGNVLKNQQDVTVLKVGLTATRNVEVRGAQVRLVSGAAIFQEASSTAVADVRLKDADTGATLMTATLPSSRTHDTDWRDLVGTFNLTANQTRNVIITVDIGNGENLNNNTITAYFRLKTQDSYVEVRDVATGDYLRQSDVVPFSVEGSAQTITPAGLTMSLASYPISQTVIRGASNVETIGIAFTAAQGGDIVLNSLGLRVYVASSSITFNSNTEIDNPQSVVTAVKLYDGSTLLASGVLEATSGGGHDYGVVTFSGLNFTIPSGQLKGLVVKIDTSRTLPQNSPHYVVVEVRGSEVSATKPDGSTVNLTGNDINSISSPQRIVTVDTAGTFSATTASDTPESSLIAVGEDGKTGVVLLKIEVEAKKEAFTITDIVLKATSTNPETFTRIYVEGIPGGFLAGETTTTLNNLNISVPVGKKTLTVTADLAGFNGALSTTTDKLGILVRSIKAKGVSSEDVQILTVGNDWYGIATSSLFALRKSVPTLTASTLPSSTLMPGIRTFYRWTVTADSKGSIEWKKITFTFDGQLNGGAIEASTTAVAITNSNYTAKISNFTIVNETTGQSVPLSNASTTGSGGTVTFSATTSQAQVIGPGSTVTYRLDATVSGTLASGDTILTKIASAGTDFVRSTLGEASGSFIWSDGVDPGEDWSNDYKVSGIPTATLILSKS